MESMPSAVPSASSSPYVKDVSVQNFMQEVIQASLQLPVLVYFTAPWCGPCKQYGPLLEKVVNAAKGKVKLARIDIDKNPQLAQQFRIQSVPMVYIFLQGQPLDGFAGAMPESQLKQLIEQVAGPAGPADDRVKQTLESAAELLAQGEIEGAKEAYLAILAEEKDNVEALAGLAKCLTLEGSFEQAEKVLADVPQDRQSAEAIVAAKAALALAKSAPKAANLGALEKAVAANPLDHQARFDLAIALFASGKQEEAVNALLAILARNKNWNEGAAKAQLLTFFEALGFASPIAAQGRRRLSSILFA
jgi:putative thioredoxin